MSKKTILTILIDTLFIISFNVLFFLNMGNQHSSIVWWCYGFLHFSYLMIIIVPLIESKEYESKLSTYSISLVYFILELIICFVVLFLKDKCNLKLIISMQVVITSIYLYLLIANLFVNNTIDNKQKKYIIENNFIKTISAKVKYLESISVDTKIKDKLSNLYYTVHSSPIKSSVDVSIYEEKIIDLLSIIETEIEEPNQSKIFESITETERLINKRNFMLKTST